MLELPTPLTTLLGLFLGNVGPGIRQQEPVFPKACDGSMRGTVSLNWQRNPLPLNYLAALQPLLCGGNAGKLKSHAAFLGRCRNLETSKSKCLKLLIYLHYYYLPVILKYVCTSSIRLLFSKNQTSNY